MAVRFSTKSINDFLTSLKTGLADGVIYLYTGAQPTDADSAVTGTLVATVTLSAGAWSAGSPTNGLEFGTAASKSISKAAAEEWKFKCTTAGTIGWGRFVGNAADAGGASTTLPRMDFSVGITSGDLKMSKVTYAVDETGVISTFDLPFTNLA